MRYTFMSDGHAAVDNDVCYEDQNEDYCSDAIDKLDAYEDTGLTPEECATIAKSYPRLFDMVYELQKYKDAEADGRLVILPCKVGDTVYRITKSGAILDELVDDIVMPEFYTRTQDGLRGLDAMWNEFGKTVFLTREEAEAAMKSKDKQTIFCEKEN